jgi:lipopolysaccharide transport system ATP-binding protein
VAAHLEPEILVVDEVLAVGDVEFQNKCLGKMREVSTREGRTVLFVSHNMAAVNTLCDKAILLKYGRLSSMGTATDIVNYYMNDLKQEVPLMYQAPESKNGAAIAFDKVYVSNATGAPVGEYALEEQVFINLEISNRSWNKDFSIGISINDMNERRVLIDQQLITCTADDKRIQCRISLPPAMLTPNTYTIDLAIEKIGAEVMDFLKNAIKFEILKTNTKYEYLSYDYGFINKACSWQVQPHRV